MKRRVLSLLTAAGVGVTALGFQAAAPQAPSSFIEGVVKGPDGKPVEGALVLARGTSSQDPPDAVRTDASGRFKVAARRPSTHLVRVEAKGLASRTIERVVPGRPLDVVLQKGAVILGAVFDGRSGEPVPGARVETRSSEVSLALPSDPSAGVVQAATDAKGRFRLENVPPGLHTVVADARGYGRAFRSPVATGGSTELFLFPGASIAGGVRDAEDKPVAGAVVRTETDMPQRSAPPRAELTAADGRFTIVGVEPGTYRLAVRHKDFAPALVGDVVVRLESETQADVVLSAGGRLVGRLLDGENRPLRGRVAVVEMDGRPAARGLQDLLRADTDADGRFRLASIAPGSHVLSLVAPGFTTTKLDVTMREGQETDAGNVILEPGLSIRGTVRSKAGTPLADATVFASQSPSMPPATAQVEADGSFALSGIGAGRYQLRATAPGHGEARRQVEAGASLEPIDFVLNPAGVITGVVVDDAGKPVESFRLTARGAPPTGPNMTMSFASKTFASPDGRFSIDVVAEGPHSLEVVAPEHVMGTASGIAVVLGQTTDAGRIRLSTGGSVRGLVVDTAGAPIPGANVTVRGAGRSMTGIAGPQATSDVSGSFDVRGVDPGTVDAVASHPLYAESRATGIEVDPAKGPGEARIVMTRGGRVVGSVRRRDGAGLPGMVVMLWSMQPGGGAAPQQITGEDGSFAFEHVRPGRMRATLMAGAGGRYTNIQDREGEALEGETSTIDFALRDIVLSGRVTRGGEPTPGLNLRLGSAMFMSTMVVGGMDQGAPRGPQRMAAITDADGRYEMIVNEPGSFRMTVEIGDSRVSLPAKTVVIPDVDAHVLDLAYGGAPIVGTVVDKETGQPIANARVAAMLRKPPPDSVGGSSGFTGPDGRFQMELDPGDYRLDARAQGYAVSSLEVDVGAAGAQDLKFSLGRGAPLEGRVVDERGRAVSGLSVFAMVPAPPPEPGETRPPTSSGGATSQGDGTFVIEGLRQQPHTVVARSNIGSFGIQGGVSPGDREVTITLKPGSTLQVLVLGPDGAPVQGAMVMVQRWNGTQAPNLGGGMTDRRGAAEFPTPAGDLELRVSKDKLVGTGSVRLAERGTGALEVTLSEGGPKPRLP